MLLTHFMISRFLIDEFKPKLIRRFAMELGMYSYEAKVGI